MRLINSKSLALVLLGAALSACGGSNGSNNSNLDERRIQTTSQLKVFKYDQSIQCESEGIPLDEARLELARAGIDVICAQKGHDGLQRIAVCGADTGNLNVFVIQPNNLVDAEKLGFKPTSDLPEYVDQTCGN